MSAAQLKKYLDATGILACNTDAYLHCLEDIGCTWADAVELIEKKELFLCKAYRKRTVYLSPRVYHLLKGCRFQRPMPEPAARLYQILQTSPGLETGELRELAQMDQRTLLTAMDFLLEELYITAVGNGHSTQTGPPTDMARRRPGNGRPLLARRRSTPVRPFRNSSPGACRRRRSGG